jgi:hypothetical protein
MSGYANLAERPSLQSLFSPLNRLWFVSCCLYLGATRLPMVSYARSGFRSHRTVMVVLLFLMGHLCPLNGNFAVCEQSGQAKGGA